MWADHKGDSNAHFTQGEKSGLLARFNAEGKALQAVNADNAANANSAKNGTYTLTHSKSGTVHTLSGLPTASGLYSCQFIASAPFNEGNTFAGGYAAKPMGEETTLPDKAFVAGDLVTLVANTGAKKLGFKLGGAVKLPPPPTEWKFNAMINTTGTFRVPKTQWYRIWCLGKCGNGGRGGDGNSNPNSNITLIRYGSGGAGGNGGGLAISILYLKEGTEIPVTASGIASFGNMLSATSGGNGGDGVKSSTHNAAAAGGQPSGVLGNGAGGTEINLVGKFGGAGGYSGTYSERPGAGTSTAFGNSGASSGQNGAGGSGGAGGGISTDYKYTFAGVVMTGGAAAVSAGNNGAAGVSYVHEFNGHPVSSGGGGGGSGAGGRDNTTQATYGGAGGAGSPAMIIIEVGA